MQSETHSSYFDSGMPSRMPNTVRWLQGDTPCEKPFAKVLARYQAKTTATNTDYRKNVKDSCQRQSTTAFNDQTQRLLSTTRHKMT